MSVNPTTRRSHLRRSWLDLAAIAAWGILLLKYAIDGTLYILIHPSYYALATITGGALVAIGIVQSWRLWRYRSEPQDRQHQSLLPPGMTALLLLGTAIAGLVITPKLFSSQAAIQRGLSIESVTLTRSQTQAFRANVKPEAKTLVDWVRTLTNNPEPDSYLGQKVDVKGFVVYRPELPADHLMLSRLVITCCAADAYPVALPVKFTGERQAYPQDSWLHVKGKMTVEKIGDRRQLTIAASELQPITAPRNPYQD